MASVEGVSPFLCKKKV